MMSVVNREGIVCVNIVAALAAGHASFAAERTVFVENGNPKCIRPVGLRWSFAR